VHFFYFFFWYREEVARKINYSLQLKTCILLKIIKKYFPLLEMYMGGSISVFIPIINKCATRFHFQYKKLMYHHVWKNLKNFASLIVYMNLIIGKKFLLCQTFIKSRILRKKYFNRSRLCFLDFTITSNLEKYF
jgi:hypothetical protein